MVWHLIRPHLSDIGRVLASWSQSWGSALPPLAQWVFSTQTSLGGQEAAAAVLPTRRQISHRRKKKVPDLWLYALGHKILPTPRRDFWSLSRTRKSVTIMYVRIWYPDQYWRSGFDPKSISTFHIGLPFTSPLVTCKSPVGQETNCEKKCAKKPTKF